MLLGREYWQVNKSMDAPSGFLGWRHRVLGHGPITVLLNTIRYGVGGGLATILHILVDSASWLFKKVFRL
ncbi:MAG: hypothetical protein NTU61_06240 [Candidatus Altiarchaeota archaeon]|nr:hypothetical protein [Candidatus Altiarchaeota archaeon]